MDKALFTRSYDQLAYLVEAEKQKEAVHSQESSEYLTYLACIVDFHHYHKEDIAIGCMEELSHRISKKSSFIWMYTTAWLIFMPWPLEMRI